jgi:hypothetical protein
MRPIIRAPGVMRFLKAAGSAAFPARGILLGSTFQAAIAFVGS